MGVSGSLLLFMLAALADLGSPVTIVWGWSRWRKRQRPVGKLAMASAVGLGLATASALLAVGAAAYAQAIGGFAFYAPPLMRIYVVGALLSLAGLAFALVGVWRRNPVRWLAIAAAICTLLFWLIAAGSE